MSNWKINQLFCHLYKSTMQRVNALKPSDVAVYAFIKQHVNITHGFADVSRKQIAAGLGLTLRTIDRSIKALSNKGVMTKTTAGKNARYFFTEKFDFENEKTGEKMVADVKYVPKDMQKNINHLLAMIDNGDLNSQGPITINFIDASTNDNSTINVENFNHIAAEVPSDESRKQLATDAVAKARAAIRLVK